MRVSSQQGRKATLTPDSLTARRKAGRSSIGRMVSTASHLDRGTGRAVTYQESDPPALRVADGLDVDGGGPGPVRVRVHVEAGCGAHCRGRLRGRGRRCGDHRRRPGDRPGDRDPDRDRGGRLVRGRAPGNQARAAAAASAAGRDYRRYFPPNDSDVLDCAYHAGYAYAETGKPGKALPQLRFFVQNAGTSASGDEAQKVLETRFVIAQLLAADGYPDEALAEFQAVRPPLAAAFGPDSTQVRNLDKQAARLEQPH
jgi:hypothetical protein